MTQEQKAEVHKKAFRLYQLATIELEESMEWADACRTKLHKALQDMQEAGSK